MKAVVYRRAVSRIREKDQPKPFLSLAEFHPFTGKNGRLFALFFCVLIFFLFSLVMVRPVVSVTVRGRVISYIEDSETFSETLVKLGELTSEEIGYSVELKDSPVLSYSYAINGMEENEDNLLRSVIDAYPELMDYRYEVYIGDEMLGAVVPGERNEVVSAIKAYKSERLAEYDWADEAYVLEKTDYQLRLVGKESYVTAKEIAEKLKANLASEEPYYTVEAHSTVTEYIPIPYTLKYSWSRKLLEGEKKESEPGEEGTREVVNYEIYKNGVLVARDCLSDKVIKEPVRGKGLRGYQEDTGKFFYIPLDNTHITNNYGRRYIFGAYEFHHGVDFYAPEGTEVYAAAAGEVIVSGIIGNGNFGRLVVIDHGNGLKTYYAHNSKLLVKVGDYVEKCDLIALSGNTGRSTGPHVHFEVRDDNVAIDPFKYMAEP